jgi:hypothetical protein
MNINITLIKYIILHPIGGDEDIMRNITIARQGLGKHIPAATNRAQNSVLLDNGSPKHVFMTTNKRSNR